MKLSRLKMQKAKITQFEKKGICSIEDLLNYCPTKYKNYTKVTEIADLKAGMETSVVGVISKIRDNPQKKVLTFTITSAKHSRNNRPLFITFFHQNFLAKQFQVGQTVLCAGKISEFGSGYVSMANPDIFTRDIGALGILPVYPKITGMSDEFLRKQIQTALCFINNREYLETKLLKKYNLIPYYKTFEYIHNPQTLLDIDKAKERMLFDELFKFNYMLEKNQSKSNEQAIAEVNYLDMSRSLIQSLPYTLTAGQNEVLGKVVEKLKKREVVNALIQGDVGCGKTIIALILALIIAENDYQCAIVAPTNILAKQHYIEACKILSPYGIKIDFISSECKQREINQIKSRCINGETQILIGTHSIFNVEFKNLGLVIIDEEHRFGVSQRESIISSGVHKITMSATPIPRSLALSLYGTNIDVLNITSMPTGRKPIQTYISDNSLLNIFSKIKSEVSQGHQAYIVCPTIKENEDTGVLSVEKVKKEALKYFNNTRINIGVVTGEMKENEVNEILELYKENKIQVLIATTIIEVGINVPNASIIGILSAERFGFAQIHQLRGRVGRSNIASSCYICSDVNPDKFQIFSETQDGFKIAKEDLILRGAGAFLGTRQSGNNKYLMLILNNEKLNENIKKEVQKILEDEKRMKRYNDFFIEE